MQIPLGKATNSIVIAPQFDTNRFPDSSFLEGYSRDLTSDEEMLTHSTFSILSDIYDSISPDGSIPYSLIGHSFGAQLLSRYAAFYYPALKRSGKTLPTTIGLANAGTQFCLKQPAIDFSKSPYDPPSDSAPQSWGALLNCPRARYNIIPASNTPCNNTFIRDTLPAGPACTSTSSPVIDAIIQPDLPIDTPLLEPTSTFPDSFIGFYVDNTYEMLAAPVVYLQGSSDINTCGGGATLNKSKSSLANGPNRLSRGVNAFYTGKLLGRKKNMPFNWKLMITKDIIGHNGKCMLESPEMVKAVSDIVIDKALGDTSDCYTVFV